MAGHPMLPFLAVIVGIAAFTTMDAAMKSASIKAGVFTALLMRNAIGTALMLPLWLARRDRAWPPRAVLWLHGLRALIVAAMAPLYFYGIVRLPLAEAMALSFIAPLIALYLAAFFLDERVRPGALAASLLGLAGVAVIALARAGGLDAGAKAGLNARAAAGIAAVLASSVLYAGNLVVQRRQAQMASGVEITLFQNALVALILLPFAWWLWQPLAGALGDVALGAVLATTALLFLAWGYARAQTQHLLPIEYTAFFWSALLGWLWFGETVAPATAIGAALIVMGCLIAARSAARPSRPPPLT